MGTKHQQWSGGFTVIETLLFLGVSAVLAVSLLTGWTAMINTQRYKDSGKSLQSFLQQQYNLVYNVENGRGDEITCLEDTSSVRMDTANTLTATERGQSNCVVMGRYILIEDGSRMSTSTIVGYDQEAAKKSLTYTAPSTDVESIARYKPTKSTYQIGETSGEFVVPWQAFIVGESDSTPRDISIAIIRAPLSGIVHTFVQDFSAAEPAIATLATVGNEQELRMCLDPGVALAGGRQGVKINRFASSQSGVQSIPEDSNLCG